MSTMLFIVIVAVRTENPLLVVIRGNDFQTIQEDKLSSCIIQLIH